MKYLIRISRALLGAAAFVFTPCSQAADAPAVADGLWKWTWTMPDGTKSDPKVRLHLEGSTLIGTSVFRAGLEAPITAGKLTGDEVSWAVVREHDGRKVTSRYHGRLAGDSIKGAVESDWAGETQRYDWEAHRVPNIPTGTWRWQFAARGPGGAGRGGGGAPGGGGPGGFGGFGGRGGGGGDIRATLKLEGTNVTGKIVQFGRDTPIQRGSFIQGQLLFETERERDGVKTVTYYWGKLDSDVIKGEIDAEFFGERSVRKWEATRVEE